MIERFKNYSLDKGRPLQFFGMGLAIQGFLYIFNLASSYLILFLSNIITDSASTYADFLHHWIYTFFILFNLLPIPLYLIGLITGYLSYKHKRDTNMSVVYTILNLIMLLSCISFYYFGHDSAWEFINNIVKSKEDINTIS